MKINKILFCILIVILFCIVFRLYNTNNEILEIENFESILKNLNKKSNKNSNKNNNSNNNNNSKDDFNDIDGLNVSNNNLDLKKRLSSLKSKQTGTTFDDLFKAAEQIDPYKVSIENMQNELYKFNESFNNKKFKKNSNSTAESIEKFGLFKKKFFEIFN